MRKYLLLLLVVALSKLSLGQCTAVSISSHPQNQTANVGSTATFSVSVNGTSPRSYFWYKNNSQISGANSSSYITPSLTASDNGNTYKCIVTNCNSTYQAISNSATLTVNAACTAVSISSHPQNQTANVGSTATFSVSVNGTSPRLYFWYKNNSQISGANSSSYTTPTLIASDNGNTYKCIVTNCNSTYQATSNSATLTVNNPCTAVTIGTQPQNQTANTGSTANFSVSANGTGPFLYFWYKNNVQISGATSSSYTTPTLASSDNGNTYKCIITNCNSTYQATSNNATLTVNTPCTAVSIGTHPQNQTANAGSTATFSVSVNGTSPFLYFWYKNGVQISGANSSSYTTPILSSTDNNNYYYCIITNCNSQSGITSNNATLTVNSNCTGVSISSQPQNQTANSGSTATFSVTASGTPPFLYFWYKNGVQIQGALSSSYITPSLTTSDNGNYYYCIITNCNSQNGITSNNATLSINTSCVGVSISSQPQNQSVYSGSTATFSVTPSGTPPFLYFWYKNGVQIPGASSSSYITPLLSTLDNGNYYYCLITNCNSQNGTSSNRANLTVNTSCTGVSISSQPQNQTGAPSASASFSVSTTGTSPSYQWQKSSDGGSTWNDISNVSPYSSATSSTLNIYPVSTNIIGYMYRCWIGGSCTTTFYSNVVTLTVQNRLWINKPLANDKYTVGQTFQIDWGDFINNTSAIGQSAYVQKKYKIELTNNNGSAWSTIKDEYVINNAISGQNNNNFNFSHSINVAGAYKIRITDKENYLNFNTSESFTVANSPSNGFTLSLHWDKSSPQPTDKPTPIGLAADGTCRILLKLLQKGTNTRQIAKINATIKPVSDSYTGTDLLGKIMYSTTPNTYSEQANNANSITTEVVTNQGLPESWFWLVAPDDFTDNLDDQRPERKINVEFSVTYTDNSTEIVSTANNPIEIVRPILFLVHGINGSDVSFNEAKYNVDGTEKTFDKQGEKNPVWKNAQRLNLYNYETFEKNAEVILGININAEKYYNSFQSQLKGMHNKGYACNKVDYVAHSMGGCIARAIINHPSGAYTLGVGQFKNYGKGFINKLITINTPHNGASFADLAIDRYQISPITWGLSLFNSGLFQQRQPSPAAKDLQAFHGGIRLNTTIVKNHLIGSDIDKNDDLTENFILGNASLSILAAYRNLLPLFSSAHSYILNKYANDEYLSTSDLVVPISSQLSGRLFNATNIGNNPLGVSDASILYGLDKEHVGIQRDIVVGTRVMRLLNAPINSSFFANSIAANTNPNGTLYRKTSSMADSIINFYDTSHIKIIIPITNNTMYVDSTFEVQIKLKNTIGLQEVKLAFQNNIYNSTSTANNQSFNLEANHEAIGKNILYAQATYDSLGFTINHIDSITINVNSLASLTGFYVTPKSQILNPKQIFQPELNAVYNNYVGVLNNDIDSLIFRIADTNVVKYDSINFQFITKDTGTTHIVFKYKGFVDTAFVYLSYNEGNANITNLCPQGNTSFSAGVNDPTKNYQWQVDAGNGYINVVDSSIYSGATTSTLTFSASPTSLYGYSYRCIVSDSIGSNMTTPQTLKFSAVWTGTSNNLWENFANWNCGVLPDENTDVVINSGMAIYPVVNSNASVRSLTLEPSATIIVGIGYTLNIKGKSQ